MDLYTLQIFSPAAAPASVHWTTYFTAFLTPVIAALTLWIAYSQWRTARNKLKLDLYEKRVVVYEAVKDCIASTYAYRKVGPETLNKYTAGITGAKWLFDNTMSKYLNEELFDYFVNFDSGEALVEVTAPGPERDAIQAKQTEIIKALHMQYRALDDRFYPFLNVKH